MRGRLLTETDEGVRLHEAGGNGGDPGPSLTAAHIGRAGEYLAASYLERRGIECSIVLRRGYDLWCLTPAGAMLTVEVKTVYRPRSCRNDAPAYKFKLGSVEADLYAFVALDRRLVLFEEIEAQSYRTIPEYCFTPELMERSIDLLTRKSPYT